jgi:quercetin dioxygenase-like cupin family protein
MASTHRPSDNLLRAGRIWPLRRARGHRIVCVRGELWITVDGRLDDYFLAAGEAFAVETDARIVVYAVEDSAFRILASQPATARYRWWHALRNAFA